MKIRFIQPGYENFNGHIGDVTFVGGESTRPVTSESAAGIASIYRIERFDETLETANQAAAAQAAAEQAAAAQAAEQVAQAAAEQAVFAAQAADQNAADQAAIAAEAAEATQAS